MKTPLPARLISLRTRVITIGCWMLGVGCWMFAANSAVLAGSRSSAAYSVITDIVDRGGGRAVSASYTSDGSMGSVAGLSTAASPAVVARVGYAGQLYDVTTLALNSASVNSHVNESTTVQLAAWQLLDDTSYLSVNANSVAWSVVSGPIASISTGGLATAAAVVQDTAATVQGIFGGLTATLNLTVINVTNDDAGPYAHDGIPDDWQAQYFGANNPAGAADADPSGTGQTNLFKYIAGLNPLDPTARFVTGSQPVAAQPGQYTVSFGPCFPGRTYTIEYKTDLASPSWTTLITFTATNDGQGASVTDFTSDPNRFYRVEITKQ